MKQIKKKKPMIFARNKAGAYGIITGMVIFLLVSLPMVSHLHSKIMPSSLKSCPDRLIIYKGF